MTIACREEAFAISVQESISSPWFRCYTSTDVVGVEIPAQHNVEASYPIAVLKESRNRAAADAFVAFVLGSAGQGILRKAGFLAP